jgi:hypothetical protein
VLAGAEVEYESDVMFADVGPRTLHVVYKPEVDASGHAVGWIAFIVDITDRRSAGEARTLLDGVVRE